ncbi:TOBE domain-containing protein [Actinotalea sp. M2MS4P-6]|uniref:TOBE domain-containing protein n=1 Tax=Actinotalea sp. M2MS4P-6 TaxID=2983762 RepID=UPI0021E4DE88|nr:TOBE domain-containing protein [Actinotalea sp. M2MS4P-6]MCV2393858.1 TOBE domain-containing protein [Actinotalea sp. M2MS4P-6]
MPSYRVSEAAGLLCVSDDTIRRWIDAGRLVAGRSDRGGPITVDGRDLARLAQELAASPPEDYRAASSARNSFTGLVTSVLRDGVMAQVEIQAGPHRVVSLMSREAADELGLEQGVLAVARVKATGVIVDAPGNRR